MATITAPATVIRTTDWTDGFQGRSRVLVLASCPNCGVAEAHAVEFEGEVPTCWCCMKEVSVSEPTVITVFAERTAHNAQCVRCSTAGQTGRGCPENLVFFERIMAHENRKEAPYLVRRERSFSTGYTEVTVKSFWEFKVAKAWASIQGGEVIDQSHLYVVA